MQKYNGKILFKCSVFVLIIIFSTLSCSSFKDQKEVEVQLNQSLVEIPMEGPVTKKKAEISGMAWMGDTLVLLPQYPEKNGDQRVVLYTIPKQSILDYLDGKFTTPISPGTIDLIMPNFKETIVDYEGFESIVFRERNVYLTIESGKGGHMTGFLVSGKVSVDNKEINLDPSILVTIPPPIQLDNRSFEALIINNNKIFTFFEANGIDVNPEPVAYVFDLNLNPLGTVPFPHLEYRVTDASTENDGSVWVINQASSNDVDIFPENNPLATKSAQDNTGSSDYVEQIVKLHLGDKGFELANTPPIQIKLDSSHRNWEGLVLIENRGFLIVTDKSPDTLLGFVPMP